MFSIVSSQSSIEKLVENSASWNQLIRNTRVFYVKFEHAYSNDPSNPDPLTLLSMAGANIIESTNYIDNIVVHPETVLEHPGSAFILNMDVIQCNSIQEDYGVLCYPIIGDTCSEPHLCIKGWTRSTLLNKRRNWKDLLCNKKVPSNSLIIIDRYLFSSEVGETMQDSFNNLTDIMDTLLPYHLKTNYHIFILFDFSQVKKKECSQISDIASKLNKIKKGLKRDFQIDIELLSMDGNSYRYEETHDRKILSNYFTITATKKIKAFRNDSALCRQDIHLKHLFSEGLDDESDIPEEAHAADIEFVNDVLAFAHKNWGNQYLFAVNGREIDNLTIVNRLLLNN